MCILIRYVRFMGTFFFIIFIYFALFFLSYSVFCFILLLYNIVSILSYHILFYYFIFLIPIFTA